MSLMVGALVGKQIDAVLVDSELMYIMLADGTQVTVRGLVLVEPKPATGSSKAAVKTGCTDSQSEL